MLKTFWDKIWKSSKFKKWLCFSNSKLLTLPLNINIESGQVLLPKAQNFANKINFGGKVFFHWKKDSLFCLKIFVQDSTLKNTPNYWIILKCTFVHCILKVQSIPSYKSDLYALMFTFSIKIWYFWWLFSSDGYLQF